MHKKPTPQGPIVRTYAQQDLFRAKEDHEALQKQLGGSAKGYLIRAYQKAAIESVFAQFDEVDRTLLVMCTGGGKTVVAGYVIAQWKLLCGRYHLPNRVLFLAHRQELVEQAAGKIREICPQDQVEVEMAAQKVTSASRARIVVASVQSLSVKSRLHKFAPDAFGLIIPDECHHAIKSNKQWDSILSYFKAKVMGITATPNRSDRIRLADTFDSVAFVYSIQDGIGDGFLVPVRVQALQVQGYDLSDVSYQNPDLALQEADQVIQQETPLQGLVYALNQIANTPNKWGAKRPTITFWPSVEAARKAALVFNRHAEKYGTGRAASIDSDHRFCSDDERRQRLLDFKSGKIQHLTNFNILGEGVDLPSIRIVGIFRPIGSQLLYTQYVGRGTRPHGSIVEALNKAATIEGRKQLILESPKPALLILEPAQHAGRHSLITAADALAGDEPDAVLEKIKKAISAVSLGGKPSDLEAEIAKARSLQAIEDEEKRRKGILIKSEYKLKEIDPFGILTPKVEGGIIPGLLKEPMATPGQKAFLTKCKVAQRQLSKLTFKDAQKMIQEVVRRNMGGLCTYAQARQLLKQGLPTDLSFADASWVVDRIVQNHFRKFTPRERQDILDELEQRRGK